MTSPISSPPSFYPTQNNTEPEHKQLSRERQHTHISISIPIPVHTVVYFLLNYCVFISWLPNLANTYSTSFPHSSSLSYSFLTLFSSKSAVSLTKIHIHSHSLTYQNLSVTIYHQDNHHNGRRLKLIFQLLGSAVPFGSDGPPTCSHPEQRPFNRHFPPRLYSYRRGGQASANGHHDTRL